MRIIDTSGRVITQLSLVGGIDPAYFGDGSDGAAVFDGSATPNGTSKSSNVYTLTRSVFYSSMILTTGSIIVNTAGYKIFCSGTLTNNGFIQNLGGNAANNTAGPAATPGDLGGSGIGGTGGTAGAIGTGVGGSPTQPAAVSTSMGGGGGAGGNGTAGASGGGAGGTGASGGQITSRYFRAVTPHLLAGATLIAGGSGGGGGGGVLMVYASTISNNGTISVAGGNGANGANGTSSPLSGSGSGGGAGGGGLLYLVYNSLSPAGTLSIGPGVAGSGGSLGASGILLKFNGTNRVWEL